MAPLNSKEVRPIGGIWAGVLSAVIITNSGYMLMVSNGAASNVIVIMLVMAAVLSLNGLLYVIRRQGLSSSRFRINTLVLLSVLILVTSFVSGENILSYIHFIGMLIVGCYISIRVAFQKFIQVTGTCMCGIVIISLCFLVYIALFGTPSPISMVNTAISDTNFFNYGLFFYPQRYIEGMARNQALFWEPGLFAGFALMALCMEIAFRDKPSLGKVIILILGILSSASSSGLILLVLVGVIAIERFFERSKAKVMIEAAVVLAVLAFLAFSDEMIRALNQLFPSVFGKLVGEESTKVTRISAPFVNLIIFSNNPVFGVGIHGANEIFNSLKSVYGIDSQTSTCTFLLAAFGVAGILINLVAIVALARLRQISVMQKLFIGVLFLLLLNVEPYQELAFLWVLFFYLIGSSLEKTDKIKTLSKADLGAMA